MTEAKWIRFVHSQEYVKEILDYCVEERREERKRVLEALKRDLQTRFVSSSNQWSKGRNSGLIECCNIIDEELGDSKPGRRYE